jgi:hypothetical protein
MFFIFCFLFLILIFLALSSTDKNNSIKGIINLLIDKYEHHLFFYFIEIYFIV